MLVPVKWLNEYVDLSDIDIKTLETKMIMSGSNTEGVQYIGATIDKVVVGKILSIHPHPNADKLVVCKADVGAQAPLQIVTGATNMKEGDYLPVALDGATISGGKMIKSGELRGQLSEGMFCSLQELGFDEKVIPKALADGLMILVGEYTLGQNVLDAVGLDDYIIEFEITPNRPDCLSMLGMAREAAATFGRSLRLPNLSLEKEMYDIKKNVKVKIENPDKCLRYACKIVENVKVGTSPQWLQSKLIKAGMRPINNIVDITNYVLLEYGQPIHAFDLDYIEDNTIVVRNAQQDEKITTLDGTIRSLNNEMLIIADPKKPLAIAGIMGGATSEVSTKTMRLLIEVANFERANIRETSKALGLRTEASSRYEKGLSAELVTVALKRVCHLIELLDCGIVVGGMIDEYPRDVNLPEAIVRPERVNRLIGVDIASEQIVDILRTLECEVIIKGEKLKVRPPYYRLDLAKEIDYIEEIARIYGYDKIAESQPKDYAIGKLTVTQQLEKNIGARLTGLGLSEIITYSFVSPNVIALLNDSSLTKVNQIITLKNPLGEEFSVMRPSMLPNILQVIAKNLKRQADSVSLYEIGNTFLYSEDASASEPLEKKKIALAMAGDNVDFYDLKSIIDVLSTILKLENIQYVTESENGAYHPGRCAKVYLNDDFLGYVGQIHPKVQKAFEIVKPCYVAELDFSVISAHSTKAVRYQSLPKYPVATRDIAFTVDADITNQAIIDIIKQSAGEYLETVKLFDIYMGEQIKAGKKSMAYTLSFRARDRTLVEEDIVNSFNAILKALETRAGVALRKM